MRVRFFNEVNNYFSLVKFSHTIFAMPFALLGYFTALFMNDKAFDIKLLGLVVICMVLARNAAMAFNRLIDSNIDKENPRTSNREIPAKKIKPSHAGVFVLVNALGFIGATWFINDLCFYLSPVALLVILGYSYTKRFTFLSHVVLGLGLSLAPLGAYLAVTGSFAFIPVFYSLAVLFWVSGFDIIYALQDLKFDKEKKLHSIPAFLGAEKAMLISGLFHLISALFILFAAFYQKFGTISWIGTAIFLFLLLYQHLIVKSDNLSRVNVAFFTTNGVASLIFAGFVIVDMIIH